MYSISPMPPVNLINGFHYTSWALESLITKEAPGHLISEQLELDSHGLLAV
jgi:hypothetical protein